MRTSRWAGVPAADRRAERRSLLLDAALDLLGTEGWSGTTVRAICHSAQLNPRYFYESFDDLDALVVALYDQLVADLRSAVMAAVAVVGDDPRAQVRATVEATVRFVDDDRRRGRVLYGEALGNEALNRRRIEMGFATAELIASDAQSISRVAATIVVGGFTETLMAWLDGRIKVSRTQLIDDTTTLFVALGVTAAGG